MDKKIIVLIIAIIILALIGGIIFMINSNKNNEQNPNNTNQQTNNVQNSNMNNELENLNENNTNTENNNDNNTTQTGKTLVVYFSHTGNTETVANFIHEAVGGDIVKLETVVPYTDDYNTLLDVVQEEKQSNARPELSTKIDNINEYSTIFLGYPNWWGDMPMAIYTFLDEYDLSGKTIAPFVTSGGSGLSGTPNKIQNAEPNATVTEGLSVSGSNAENSQNLVNNWISGLELNMQNEGDEQEVENARIKLTVNGNQEVYVNLDDNQASNDFLEMLPLTLTFEDYNNTEKIATLPNSLGVEGLPYGYTPEAGDFSYYAPWGNISIFYKDFRYSNSLYKLGTIESGAEIFENINEDFTVTIERIN